MESTRVSKSQFKARALEYLRQVEATGDTVVVTDNGHPTVEVRRFRADPRTPLERLRGSVVEYRDPFEPVGESNWEALA
ncbi:prevent-host-death protein [Thioalkalivibrio denitrificans]|uniref:Prevent-host-death protein n=1 Tax=Thioalkalivibrio denitrificans TaxID=108003 RepID=A0A1V3N685_9GAMM|nr:type II toxin-antitoxin system prevent-host-death family antitoxin [Thioalkalivibrio denitrificans]OOG20525.1 prevent-host-death protein [Thioalkalivibrio denitrificans]